MKRYDSTERKGQRIGRQHVDTGRQRRIAFAERAQRLRREAPQPDAVRDSRTGPGCPSPPCTDWPPNSLRARRCSDAHDGRFEVGRLIWSAGLLAPVEGRLRQVAEPFLHDVYAATLATVHLAVRDGDEVLYLERMMGRTSVPIVSSVGSRLPMHCTGVGKVLLAFAPRQVQDRVLANLTRITPYTIVTAVGVGRPAGAHPPRGGSDDERGDVARRVFAGRAGGAVVGRCRGGGDRGGGRQASSATANGCSAPCRSPLAASAGCCNPLNKLGTGPLDQCAVDSVRQVRR